MGNVHLLFGKPRTEDKEIFLAELRDIQKEYNCIIQALDADKVVSEKHAHFAAKKALRAFSESRNVARDVGLEILRYASGQRQIERALSMGISKATQRVALILVENGIKPEITNVFEADGRGPSWNPEIVMDTFDVQEEEIMTVGKERIPDLVLERVALVDAYR